VNKLSFYLFIFCKSPSHFSKTAFHIKHTAHALFPAELAMPEIETDGTTYPSGEMFYGYNTFSFYDIETDMADKRQEQPSSLRKAAS